MECLGWESPAVVWVVAAAALVEQWVPVALEVEVSSASASLESAWLMRSLLYHSIECRIAY